MHSDIARDQHSQIRLGCQSLAVRTDRRGLEVLGVRTTYREGIILPGGAAHPGELVHVAAARELREETGLVRTIRHYFITDLVDANADTGSPRGINYVCDAGELLGAEAAALSIPPSALGEVAELVWMLPVELPQHCAPFMVLRIQKALAARSAGIRNELLHYGEPVAA
ncbi:NUDIX domain-containing protein [Kitasatospora sp. NBC_00070]|uniref:NUDIX domain-containing protein n=1 Tax=Kitasatospora sp. NBC_00070 TaxID=2975962 RepID=UPI0032539FFB